MIIDGQAFHIGKPMSKRKEAELKSQKRQAERQKRADERSRDWREKTRREFLDRFAGMNEVQVMALLQCEADVTDASKIRLNHPRTEFERIRTSFSKHGVEFSKACLKLVSSRHYKLYCSNGRSFSRLQQGDWSQMRAQLGAAACPDLEAMSDVRPPPTNEEILKVAEYKLEHKYFDEARRLFTEAGCEDGLKREKEARQDAFIRSFDRELKFGSLEKITSMIEELPEEHRRELRLAYAKQALAVQRHDDFVRQAIAWYKVVEYVHEHKLAELYAEATNLAAQHIEQNPEAVAVMVYEREWFTLTESEVPLLFESLLSSIARGGDPLYAELMLEHAYPPSAETPNPERRKFLLMKRKRFLHLSRFEEAERPEFSGLPPITVIELLSRGGDPYPPLYSLDQRSKDQIFLACLARAILREAQPDHSP